MKELLATILATGLMYILLTIIVNTLLFFTIYQQSPIVVKIPKPRKFRTKRLSPIYKLTQDMYENWYIEKWEMRWGENEGAHFVTYFILPFLIVECHTYGYKLNEYILYVCKKEEVVNINEELSSIYEKRYLELQQEQLKELEKKQTFHKKVDELNSTFNDNYTK